MSIIIQRLPGGDHLGICEYSIIQNGELLTTFKHDRSDDLKVCLQKAADAVARGRWEKTGKLYSKHGGG